MRMYVYAWAGAVSSLLLRSLSWSATAPNPPEGRRPHTRHRSAQPPAAQGVGEDRIGGRLRAPAAACELRMPPSAGTDGCVCGAGQALADRRGRTWALHHESTQ